MDFAGPIFGAGNRSRTYDLRITNALLYQLSYSGIPASPADRYFKRAGNGGKFIVFQPMRAILTQ